MAALSSRTIELVVARLPHPYALGYPAFHHEDAGSIVDLIAALDYGSEGLLDIRTGGDGDNGEFLQACLAVLVNAGIVSLNRLATIDAIDK